MPHMMTTRKRQASLTDNEAVGAPKRPCYRPSFGCRRQSRNNNNNKRTKSQSLVMNSGSPEPKEIVSRYTAKNPEPEQTEQGPELSPSRTDQIAEVVSEEESNKASIPNLRPSTQYLIIQTSPNQLFVFQQVANVVSDRPLVPLVQDQTNLRLQPFGIGIGRLFWNTLKQYIASYIMA